MNKASLAAVAFGLFALAGCGSGDQDRLNMADNEVVEDLNALSDQAANVAAEAEALQNQAANLEQEAADNAAGPEVPADENIAGM